MHLPSPVYAVLRRLMPIACVDALPYRHGPAGLQVGLINRYTSLGRERGWTLVGGRVRFNESMADALDRHLRNTLGPEALWTLPNAEIPARADEYFPHPRRGERRDPNKHAIALSYAVAVSGSIHPVGEALDFQWFPASELPSPAEIGYGQAPTIEELAAGLQKATSSR